LGSSDKRTGILKSSYVKTIILAVTVVGSVVAFWFGLRLALGTEYPFLTVASGSMRPTLNIGDLIVVQGIYNFSGVKAELKPNGDVIVFHSPRMEGELIVHRAVDKTQHDGLWFFETEGDANSGITDVWTGPDTWNGMISEKLLVGRVIGKVPWLGYVPLYIRTPLGLAIIVILVVIIIFAEYIPLPFRKKSTSLG